MKTALEVGQELVAICRQGKHLEAIEKLYAPDIVSIEPHPGPNMPAQMRGLKAVRGKGQWWVENHEIHSSSVKGPFPHGDRFIIFFHFDVTPKAGPMKGQRMVMEEAGLYTVKNGKVAQEEFFYHMGG